jgi:hypothetical protein
VVSPDIGAYLRHPLFFYILCRMNSSETDNTKPLTGGRWTAGVWLALLASALTLHVWFPRVDAEPINDTYNVDVGGRNAIYQFAQRRAIFASRNHDSLVNLLDGFGTDTTLCLLGPARFPTPREWKALLDWVRSGGKLLLAARWNDAEVAIPGMSAQVKSTKPKDDTDIFGNKRSRKNNKEKAAGDPAAKPEAAEEKNDAAESTKEAESTKVAETAAPPSGPNWTSLIPDANFTWKTFGTIEAPGAEVLVKTGASPQAVRLNYGSGTIVLLASDFIFSNAALYEREKSNGLLAVRLLNSPGASDEILFDESLNATGTPRVVGVLLDPMIRPATVQLVVLLVIFGWVGTRRFGGFLPRSAPARHDVADHTNSLGNLYFKAHHSKGVLREYLAQLKTELHLRYSKGHEERVLQPIAERAKMSVEEVQRLLAAAEAAAGKPRLSRREAAFFIRRLAHLRHAARSRA